MNQARIDHTSTLLLTGKVLFGVRGRSYGLKFVAYSVCTLDVSYPE